MIKHKHHIIPKHAGGTDDPQNLIEVTIEEHAEAHRELYYRYGRWQDKLAWLGLAETVGKDEIIQMRQKESGRMSKMSFETHSEIAKNMWAIPGMKEHLSRKRKEQSQLGKNPMQGKKQKRVCCLQCKSETSVNTLKQHQTWCENNATISVSRLVAHP